MEVAARGSEVYVEMGQTATGTADRNGGRGQKAVYSGRQGTGLRTDLRTLGKLQSGSACVERLKSINRKSH